jgi:hypothetical protein
LHVSYANIQEKNRALYSLRSELSNEVSLGVSFYLKKKISGGCALLGGDMQKPYVPKCGQAKTKIDLFWDFLLKQPMFKLWFLFQLKFPHCIMSEINYLTILVQTICIKYTLIYIKIFLTFF